MKRNVFAAILLTAIVAYACSSVEEPLSPQTDPVGDDSVVYTPTATIEGFVLDEPETKTVLTIDETLGAKFTFAEGDHLGVYPYVYMGSGQGGSQRDFSVKSINELNTTFNGAGFGLKANQYYAAYYPLCQAGYGDTDAGVSSSDMMTQIPMDYTAQRQTVADAFDISVCEADYLVSNAITPVDGVCNFSMQHVGALVVMYVTLSGEGFAHYTELSLTTTASNSFTKTGTIDVTQLLSGDQPNFLITPKSTGKTVTLTLGTDDNGLVLNAGTTPQRFCLMVAPADLRGDNSLTVTLKDKAGESHSATVNGKNFKAGKAYKIACSITAATSESDPVPTNLSKTETANCYIVDVDNINAYGYYFDASVAGNGEAGALTDAVGGAWYPAAGTYALTKTGVSLKTHFNTNGCVSDLAYNANTKNISFKASGNEGVAKITLLDSDSDGIWTWLIWCTDNPGTVTYTNPVANLPLTIMDRNLGATMASSSELQTVDDIPKLCGLYYSWGRPVPLSPDYEANAFGARAYTWGPGMEQTFKDPDRFTRNDVNVFFNYWGLAGDAMAEVGRLWGDPRNTNSDNSAPDTRRPIAQIQKTIYDPCPAGYQVAPVYLMEGYDDTASFTEFHADPFGVYIDGADGSVYFPYAGRCLENGLLPKGDGNSRFTGLTGGDPDCDGSGYWIWTSGHVNSNTCWMSHLAYNNDGRAQFGGGLMSLGAPAYAMSIRCVADDK